MSLIPGSEHARGNGYSDPPSAVSMPKAGPLGIDARRLSHSYGDEDCRTQVLFDISLEIGRGEMVILTGPSGSGKTTLLTLVGALRRVQEGTLRVLGQELTVLNHAEQVELRRRIGFIFQLHNLFSSLTALENVRMAAGLGQGSAAEAHQRSRAILEDLGLGDRLDHRPARLSGGQRQRVAIARALVNEPPLILADEPTASLDTKAGDVVVGMLRRLAEGPSRSTILLVTHDQRLIERADRVVRMVDGRIASNVLTAQTVRITQALARNAELAPLGASTLARFAARMTLEHRNPGDIIVREGEPGDRFYLIASGEAETFRDGQYRRALGASDVFGEITPIFGQPIPATVRAKSHLELYVLDAQQYRDVIATDKSFEEHVQLYLMTLQR